MYTSQNISAGNANMRTEGLIREESRLWNAYLRLFEAGIQHTYALGQRYIKRSDGIFIVGA